MNDKNPSSTTKDGKNGYLGPIITEEASERIRQVMETFEKSLEDKSPRTSLSSSPTKGLPRMASEVMEPLSKDFLQDLIQDSKISSSTPNKGRSRNNSANFTSPSPTQKTSGYSPLALDHQSPGKRSEVTLGDYLYTELRRGYDLGNDEQRYRERREKFYIFMKIPYQLEKFISYGFLQCADAFLFVFTLLPVRFVLALWFSFSRPMKRIFSESKTYPPGPVLQPAEIVDILKGVILIVSSFLMSYIDIPMLYHIIKSQSVIKLYIFFNMLEVADKLFSSFGQDILDALFWTATESRGRKRDHLGVIPHLSLATIYVFLHTLLVLLQATTLNVAINSKNKALLTIMMSNNFVELKSMVFKKFEKNNLFHMSCSDVRERFHYLILLFVVCVQTLKEYNWSENHLYILLQDSLCILSAEIIVDWLKHAFVTRFNEISPEVYGDYGISLAYDLTSSKLKSAFSDHSDIVSRRMGFIPLPLGVLVYRVMSGSLPSLNHVYGMSCFILGYFCLGSLKAWINILLLGLSCEKIDHHKSQLEKKTPLVRACSSLPSSRHGSVENIVKAVNTTTVTTQSKSTPHTPTGSQSSSLADITAQAQIIQETLGESSMIMSDSQVSLLSMDVEGRNNELLNKVIKRDGSDSPGTKLFHRRSILRNIENNPNSTDVHKRRVSLQESQLESSSS